MNPFGVNVTANVRGPPNVQVSLWIWGIPLRKRLVYIRFLHVLMVSCNHKCLGGLNGDFRDI